MWGRGGGECVWEGVLHVCEGERVGKCVLVLSGCGL